MTKQFNYLRNLHLHLFIFSWLLITLKVEITETGLIYWQSANIIIVWLTYINI